MFNRFLEEFLDELELDIDFDNKSQKFVVNTSEGTYTESIDMPTLSQLMNQKSDEFMQAIITDIDPFIEADLNDITEYSDREAYELEMKFRTKINSMWVDLTDMYFKDSVLEMNKETKDAFVKFFKDNNFVEKKQFQDSPNVDYKLKIDKFDQIPKILNNLEKMAQPYKRVRSFKDLDESVITRFFNFTKQ